ncbi:hypothetical protein CLV40_11496 [Actinokineospora auranticolor]|uniref:Uncharacterized protein n=1 Tax=Actinokineospora auranticolor TaxID=155976 RepID=A0A2S6GJN3_9PSEU|nr:hypothetical protein CLV40_11496 [Actinokineospora auranticolor]
MLRSQREWVAVRRAAEGYGRELNEVAMRLYPRDRWVFGDCVLSGEGWTLPRPVELDHARLAFTAAHAAAPRLGPLDHVLPLATEHERFSDFSAAVGALVRPRLLEDRPSYRLLDLSHEDGLALTFGLTTYFEVFTLREAMAHELKAAWLRRGRSTPDWSDLPLRAAVADPFDPAGLLMSPGIGTLTIRRDADGDRFLVHRRDGRAVADGGSLCTVVPAGEFQPTSPAPADVRADFDLWRNIMREYSEELLGHPERAGGVDYHTEEPFRAMDRARRDGRFRVWHYGLVLDPVTLGASQRTVAVLDGEVFDELFAGLVTTNAEGWIVGERGRVGVPFTDEAIGRVERLLTPASRTLVRMAWRDRELFG